VVFDSSGHTNYLGSELLENTTFSSFDSSCHVSAAVAVGYKIFIYWNAGNAFRSLRFATSTEVNKVYLFPSTFKDGSHLMAYNGEPAR